MYGVGIEVIVGAAINLRARAGDALRRQGLVPFRIAADDGHQLVFPIDFGERVGVGKLGSHVGVERMVQEEVAVVDARNIAARRGQSAADSKGTSCGGPPRVPPGRPATRIATRMRDDRQ